MTTEPFLRIVVVWLIVILGLVATIVLWLAVKCFEEIQRAGALA